MKIKGLPASFKASYAIMNDHLGLDELDLTLSFVISKEMTVEIRNGVGEIRCSEIHHLNRLLALIKGYYKGEDLTICEKACFKTLSIMLDVSFGGPLNMDALKEYFRQLASLGYNQLWFYIEDMYEMPEKYKHFGYMRGRYSAAELRELDGYADSIGIEIVPCIQTLGHMQHYLKWSEASKYKENGFCLLPGEETTYELIRDMLVAVSSVFRSRRVHVGLDESAGLGTGTYLRRNGYREPLNIFIEHVQRVAEICSELGLRPMMWNDMVFCYLSEHHEKYPKKLDIPESVISAMPKNMELVYWNYEDENCSEFIIDKNREFGNPVIFAGGVWIFGGLLPDNEWSEYFHEKSIEACKKKGIEEICMTVWSYSTTIYQTSLLEAARFAELTYEDSSALLPERFEKIIGASYEAFYDMSNYHALYKEGEVDYKSMFYGERFYGNKLMWQDLMLGIFDEKLYRESRYGHYGKMADQYLGYMTRGDGWEWLYSFCHCVFKVLSLKTYISEKIAPAYKSGDKKTLAYILAEKLPALENAWLELTEAHHSHKDEYLRPFGAEIIDGMYGPQIMRTRYAMRRLGDYLGGIVDSLPELAEPRYDEGASAWGWSYGNLLSF
ncbi:MAG: family 20 glycosylhydrolase [Clostridia bacterium]|nr:family 20 glycosylhydrolase [Clostridia bacterium]